MEDLFITKIRSLNSEVLSEEKLLKTDLKTAFDLFLLEMNRTKNFSCRFDTNRYYIEIYWNMFKNKYMVSFEIYKLDIANFYVDSKDIESYFTRDYFDIINEEVNKNIKSLHKYLLENSKNKDFEPFKRERYKKKRDLSVISYEKYFKDRYFDNIEDLNIAIKKYHSEI